MSLKLLWLGLTLIVVTPLIPLPISFAAYIGALAMVLGCALLFLDK